jgi:hypothetical protein
LLKIGGIRTRRNITLRSEYINNISILVNGLTTEDATKKLKRIAKEYEKWAKKHAFIFTINKFEFLHFAHKRDKK